jgi:hypothetical protein
MGASAPFFFSTRFEGKEAAPFETASFFYCAFAYGYLHSCAVFTRRAVLKPSEAALSVSVL